MISKDLLQKGPCVLHVKHKVLTLFQRTIIFLYEKAVTHQKRRRGGENMKGASVLCQIKIGFPHSRIHCSPIDILIFFGFLHTL